MMEKAEIEQLLLLLRKFNQNSGTSILEMEIKIIEYARSTPIFKVRDGVFMDEKMAYEYDMQKMEDNYQRLEERREREGDY